MKYLKYILPIILFLAVSFYCFVPQLQGLVLPQHDTMQFDGMSADIRACRADTGEDPQWTGAMFGGMPAYLINIRYNCQIVKIGVDWLTRAIPEPAGLIFFAMLLAFIGALMFGMPWWACTIVGLAYGLSTYFFLIIGAGHITKMWAAIWAPALVGAVYMTLSGRVVLGGTLSAFFGALILGANHPQVTYYFGLVILAMWVSSAIFAIREKKIKIFAKRSAVLGIAAIVALCATFAPLYYTISHTHATTRGGSEIATSNEDKSGLDLRYATAWSYGLAESWNMAIPNLAGGSSMDTFPRGGAVATFGREIGLNGIEKQLPTYWGGEPFTAGPTYLGIVAILLAVIGIALCGVNIRWWILFSLLLTLLLAWGCNAMWFSAFAFKWLPMYNKFRTVSMALMVWQWAIPLLAGFGVWKLWNLIKENQIKQVRKIIAISVGIVGGITLILGSCGSAIFDFNREADSDMMSAEFERMLSGSEENKQLLEQGYQYTLGAEVANAMASDRAEILSNDAYRAVIFIILTAIALLLLTIKSVPKYVPVVLIAILLTIDLTSVGLRYQPHSAFVTPAKNKIQPTQADKTILADKSLGYRVLNLSVSPFNDATTSFFHRSVGGYHGAKLGRYQDIIDKYLNVGNEGVYDMLNTKYIITSGGEVVQRNPFGAAWFASSIAIADSPERELNLIGEVDLSKTAVVSQSTNIVQCPLTEDFQGSITLTSYQPNHLVYRSDSSADAYAIFSEIYYKDGWKVYIDGVESDYFCADYIIRAMLLPKGSHTIEWIFKAPNWTICSAITLIGSLLIVILLIVCIIYEKRVATKA